VIGPNNRIKLTLSYPMTMGRNFDEIIRVLDSRARLRVKGLPPRSRQAPVFLLDVSI
jgi:alkyl hydroperoxide reductase subunit AhpC